MKYPHLIRLLIFFYCIFVGFYFAMIYREKYTHDRVHVVSTTSIIGDIVQQVAGDLITCHVLMGAGVDPHLYKPLENDIMQIAQADILFYNGLHLEAQMEHVFKHLANYKTTVAVSQDILEHDLIPSSEYDNHYDPHLWFNIPLWIQAIETVTRTLCLHDPEHAPEYEKNSRCYIAKCQATCAATVELLGKIPKEKRILITGHDAFQYFAQAYNFQVVGLQGMSTESQVGSQEIQAVIDFIVAQKIPAIFVETSTPMRNIQALQEGVARRGFSVEIGGELFSDALGAIGTRENSYLGMIESNVATIYQALK
jgi:manganese/zinc/iron transport system substrate-binding protein